MVVEVALQWCSDSFSDLLVGFVNSVKTIDGGTHIDGLKVCERLLLSIPFQTLTFILLALQGWWYCCCRLET